MDSCSLALPSGMLPEPTRNGKSLALYSRSPKAVATWRGELLPLQQGARSVLALLIARGRGKRYRSWLYAETMAELLPRSGVVEHYSVQHVYRGLRQLHAAGLIRWKVVKPGETFPAGATPDVDGGGVFSESGGKVYEVNMDALCGRGLVWRVEASPTPTPRALLDDDDAADVEAIAAVAELRAELEATPPPEALATPSASPEGVIIHGRGGVIIHDRPSLDLGSPSENNSDPACATSTPRERLAYGSRTPADAGSRHEGDPSRTAPPIAPRGAFEHDERASRGKSRALEAPPPAWLAHASPPRTALPTESARREREQPPIHPDDRPGPPRERDRLELERACGVQLFLQRRTT